MPRGPGGFVAAYSGRGAVLSAGGDSLRGGFLSSSAGESARRGVAVAEGSAKAGGVFAGLSGDRYGFALSERDRCVGDCVGRRAHRAVSSDLMNKRPPTMLCRSL